MSVQVNGAGKYPSDDLLRWTPRQREVLTLLTRGRTNGEIAMALGISLDGAKWHVREIMSKLGVETREDAAEYWRWRNGWATRLRLTARRATAFVASRWALGIAGATAGAASAVLVVVLLLALPADDTPTEDASLTPTIEPTGAPSGTPGATPSVTATVDAAPAPTQQPTPGIDAQPLAEVGGIPIYELTIGDPRPLPAQTVLYYIATCGVCTDSPLSRAWLDADGALHEENLLDADDPRFPEGYPTNLVHDGGPHFAVTWCVMAAGFGGCDKHNPERDQVPRLVLLSRDGGVTWEQGGELPPGALLTGFEGDEAIAVSWDDAAGEWIPTRYPSGLPASRPTTSEVAADGPLVFQADGTRISVTPRIEGLAELANESSTFLWRSNGTSDSPPDQYYVFPGGQLRVAGTLSPTLLVGLAYRNAKATLNSPPTDLEGFDARSVVADFEAREIAPILGLTDVALEGIMGPIGVAESVAYQVSGTGSCLNVRAEPSLDAEILDCLADRVLLRDGGETVEADGETWRAVTTLDGRTAWASTAYLEPIGAASAP